MSQPRRRPWAIGLALLAVAGCGASESILHVSLRSDDALEYNHAEVAVISAGRGKSRPIDIPVAASQRTRFDFNLRLDAEVDGFVVVEVSARSNLILLATGSATADITPGEVAEVTIDLDPGDVDPPDMGFIACSDDQPCPGILTCCTSPLPCAGRCVADCRRAAPCPTGSHCDPTSGLCPPLSWDLSAPADLAVPDFTFPDLTFPDLMVPDQTKLPPDMVQPPDQTWLPPDMVQPRDQTTPPPDLVKPDLLSIPDMVPCKHCGTAACIDFDVDRANCGTCGNNCTMPTPYCSAGTCASACQTGLTVCGALCVNLQTNLRNCGMCGRVCNTGVCVGGMCRSG